MATFIGYNTVGQYKDYTLTDDALIRRDLLNFFNIKQGELPGKPEVGSSIWNMLFENQNSDTTEQITREIQRACNQDPRIALEQVDVYPQDNGILIEVAIRTVSNTTAEQLRIYFDAQNQTASFA